MSQPEIIYKLKRFLSDHPIFVEECEAMYFLVEIRKVLDHDKNTSYPILRFYCDWAVHTSKDRITNEIKVIMLSIYQESHDSIIKGKETVPSIKRLLYMEHLKQEIERFITEYGLPDNFVSSYEAWITFIALIVQILVDQPINNPCDEIACFQFLPARSGAVRGIIIFKEKIGDVENIEYVDTY